MTTGIVDIKVFGPPIPSSELPPKGIDYGRFNHPDSAVNDTNWPMVLVDGVYRPKGPNGYPLWVPHGTTQVREMISHERDKNMVTQYAQFLMFMGMVNNSLEFNDGTYNYATFSTVGTSFTSGFYVSPTQIALPSGAVSNLTIPNTAGAAIFMSTNSSYIIPASPGFTVSSYTSTFAQTSFQLTTSLTAGSSSFNVAQCGFLPAEYVSTNELNLLFNGASPNQFTAYVATAAIPTTPVAIYTTYQLSQTYTVPASGAITIEYGVTANL